MVMKNIAYAYGISFVLTIVYRLLESYKEPGYLKDVLTLEQFRSHFGSVIHPFTGVDYVDYYQRIIQEAGAQAEIIFSNRVQSILPYTDTVICCDIHTRQRSKRLLKAAGAKCILGLDDLLTSSVDGSGYNPQYGLLGSNKADDGADTGILAGDEVGDLQQDVTSGLTVYNNTCMG